MYFGTILKNWQCWEYLRSWLPCVFKPLNPFCRDKEKTQELFITVKYKADDKLCGSSGGQNL